MDRVGYDADTQTYTYQDEEGNYWQGEPGVQYGRLQRTGTTGRFQHNHATSSATLAARQSQDWRYMAPWLLIVIVVLLLVWYWFGPTFILRCGDGLQPYRIRSGDTCWNIADSRATTVDELININKGLSCDRLKPGMQICMP